MLGEYRIQGDSIMKREVTRKQYFMSKSSIRVSIVIGILIAIYGTVGSALLEYSNTRTGYILLGSVAVFVLTYLFARVVGVPDVDLEYQFSKDNLKSNGLNELKAFISKEELISNMRQSEYKEISKTVYAKQIRGLFVKNILVVLIKEYKDFKKFNESDKLYSKIRSQFKLPSDQAIQKDIRKLRSFKIHTLEIVYLESVSEQDIKAYQHETAQSITHNLRENGVLYDKSLGTFMYYDFHRKAKRQAQTFFEVISKTNETKI